MNEFSTMIAIFSNDMDHTPRDEMDSEASSRVHDVQCNPTQSTTLQERKHHIPLAFHSKTTHILKVKIMTLKLKEQCLTSRHLARRVPFRTSHELANFYGDFKTVFAKTFSFIHEDIRDLDKTRIHFLFAF